MSLTEYSRDGYDPEWLALEDAMGGRYRMDANLDEKVPEFNSNFGALAKLWPDPEEALKIHDEDVEDTKYSQACRIYQPESKGRLPLMVFFHGGGFVAGNLDTDEPQCKYYAAKTPCVVVSIQYPLAPTYKFDAIKDACVEATSWARKNAHRWNADASRTLTCGGSAGANLAATVAYHFSYVAKDPSAIAGCVLLFPAMGNWKYQGKFAEYYRAWDEMATGDQPFLNRILFEEVANFWEVDWLSPAHFPLLESDLSKYPPCYFAAGSKDILKDDGLVFDMRLRDVGVRSRYKLYEGMPHWFQAFPQLSKAHVMLADNVEGIKWLLKDAKGHDNAEGPAEAVLIS